MPAFATLCKLVSLQRTIPVLTLRFTVMTTAVMTAVPKLVTVACVPLCDTAATRASAANGT
jgi:hypothetical protein